MRAALIASFVLAGTSIASASPRVAADDRDDEDTATTTDEQLVLLNATSKLGDRNQIERIRRVLDSKGLLLRLPDRVEAALDGRSVLIGDLESIRDAYTRLEFALALDMVEADETRILENVNAGDPIPALAELAEWRGLISAGMERPDEATKWFRLAVRLNPTWDMNRKFATARVRPFVKKARKPVEDTGVLRVAVDPENAMIQIDDRKAQPLKDKLTLETGYHLVTLTAPGRGSYAEIVEISEDQPFKLEISLDKETSSDRAAKLIDATVTAPAGNARLKKARALSKVAKGATRYLVIEEGNEDKLTLRYYDTSARKVSKPIELLKGSSSNGIAKKLVAALDPDNMIEPTSITIIEKQRSQRWYERWYVWAGVAAIAGGGFLGYQYMTREPTSIRGF